MHGFNPGHPREQTKLFFEVSLHETERFSGRQYTKSITDTTNITVHSLVSLFLGLRLAQCFLLLTQCLSFICSPQQTTVGPPCASWKAD